MKADQTRNRRMLMAGAVLLLAWATMGACTPETPGKGICFRVSGGKNTVYLLGSIHVGNQRMKRFGPSITQAMESADAFVFECDTQSEQARQTISAMTRAEKPLQERLTPETYTLVYQTAEKLGVPLESYNGLQSWAITSQLSAQTAAIQMGVKDAGTALALGVEEQVRAGSMGKDTLWLETPEEQLAVLSGFSQALQEELLKSACQLILNPQTTNLQQWPEWWLAGDTEAFVKAYEQENELNDPALTKEYHDGLVTGRNLKMTEGIKTLLESDEPRTYFVTVGLLHLVLPEDSIPWELEQAGYQVAQME